MEKRPCREQGSVWTGDALESVLAPFAVVLLPCDAKWRTGRHAVWLLCVVRICSCVHKVCSVCACRILCAWMCTTHSITVHFAIQCTSKCIKCSCFYCTQSSARIHKLCRPPALTRVTDALVCDGLSLSLLSPSLWSSSSSSLLLLLLSTSCAKVRCWKFQT